MVLKLLIGHNGTNNAHYFVARSGPLPRAPGLSGTVINASWTEWITTTFSKKNLTQNCRQRISNSYKPRKDVINGQW